MFKLNREKIIFNIVGLFLIISILSIISASPFGYDSDDSLTVTTNIFQGNLTNLSEMQDVNIPSPSNDDVLTWDSTTVRWIAQAISALSEPLWNANYSAFLTHITWGEAINGTLMLTTGDTATGNYTFDTNTLFIDSTNNRVGIGTNSPIALLDINGSMVISGGTQSYSFADRLNTLAIQGQSSGTESLLELYTKDGDGTDELELRIFAVGTPDNITNRELFQFGYSDITNTFDIETQASGTGVARDIRIIDDGTIWMTFQAGSGNVGINTTTPQNLLNVLGDINFTGLIYGNGSQLTGLTLTETDPIYTGENSTIARTGNCGGGTVVHNITTSGVECITDADSGGGGGLTTEQIYITNDTTTISFNTTLVGTNLSVNSSDFWDSLDIPTDLNNKLTLVEANITDLQTYIINNTLGWIANFTNIYSLDWTNVTVTESQISDLQNYRLLTNFSFFGDTNITGNFLVTTLDSASCDVKAFTNGTIYCGIDADSGVGGLNTSQVYVTNTTTTISFNETLAGTNLSVNSSDFWDGLDTFNSTQFEEQGGLLHILDSWFSALFDNLFGAKTTDDLTQGSTNFYDNQTWNETRADTLYILQSNEANLNVNSSNFWDDLNTSADITGLDSTNINDIYLFNTGDTATGDYTFDTDTFFIDAAANRVGIGTIIPAATLHLDSTDTAQIRLERQLNTDEANMWLSTASVNDWFIGLRDTGDSNFHIFSSGLSADALTIERSTGNVGIGVTSPAELLEVEDNNATTGIQISNTAADGDPFLAFALSGTKIFTMGIDDGDGDKFKIGTTAIGTNTRVTIDSSGDFGIGTSSPGAKLEVLTSGTGDIAFFQTSADSGQLLAIGIDTTNKYLFFDPSSSTNTYDITFFKSDATPMMTLDQSSGFVGINTITPSHELNVVGFANFTQNVTFGDCIIFSNGGQICQT